MGNSDSLPDATDSRGSDSSLDEDKWDQEVETVVSGHPNVKYASVMFRRYDQVWTVWGDTDFRAAMKHELYKYLGLSDIREHSAEIYYIKLPGSPFNASKISETFALKLRLAGSEILKRLHSIGWILVCSSNLARKNSVASWFFHKMTLEPDFIPERNPDPLAVLSISSADRIDVANVPSDVCDMLVATAKTCYPKGVVERHKAERQARGLTLKGEPWNFTGEDRMEGIVLIVQLMVKMEQHGFSFYGTGDFKGTSDTMFFLPAKGCFRGSYEDYAILSMDETDELMFHNIDPHLLREISDGPVKLWPDGVEKQGPKEDGYMWKLNGKPWWCSGKDAVSVRKMLVGIFDVLSQYGYAHYATLDLSRRISDKSFLVFRRNRDHPNPQIQHAAVSMSSNDKLRLISFPKDCPLHKTIPEFVKESWSKGVKEVKENFGTTEIKFSGTPWDSMFSWKSNCQARMVMSGVLAALNAEGWSLIACADISAKCYENKNIQYPLDVDCWFVGKTDAFPGSSYL